MTGRNQFGDDDLGFPADEIERRRSVNPMPRPPIRMRGRSCAAILAQPSLARACSDLGTGCS